VKSQWYRLSDERLLDLRLCDLPVRIEGSRLEVRIERLYAELSRRGFRFRPHIWLSEEFFASDGVPGFAIPFYLAHPRLIQLERRQMVEAEGSSQAECMRILRHEAGHTLDTAYRLHFRKRWRELFGSFAQPYPQSYQPRPNSRDYVLNLNAWYAQAHPAEDFAETFAVWLRPRSHWQHYRGWLAFKKLRYVDQLMREIAPKPPVNDRRLRVEPLSRLTHTLRQHYRRKKEYYDVDWPPYYDQGLRRIFSESPAGRSRPASVLLRRLRREICPVVAKATGVHAYTVDHLFGDMIARSRVLRLRAQGNAREIREQVLAMLTAQTMNILQSGYHRIAL